MTDEHFPIFSLLLIMIHTVMPALLVMVIVADGGRATLLRLPIPRAAPQFLARLHARLGGLNASHSFLKEAIMAI